MIVAIAAAALLAATGPLAQGAGLGRTTSSSALASTAGCGRTPTLTSGTHTIQSGGRSRTFILRIPDGYDNTRPYRLIFAFHWRDGTATDVATGQTVQRDTWAYYGLLQLSNNSTIFVAPQGINNGWANTGGEDVTFTDDMLRQIESDLCVDTSQVFSMGWSFGGGMSFALACARPNVFRAVAVYSGAQISGCSGGTQPVAYFGAHGIRDSVLNISNGRALRDRFVGNNGCAPQNPPEPARGSLTHTVTAYSGCRAGFPVVWAAFDDDHNPAPSDGATGLSPRTWLPAETWRFITQFESTSSPSPTPTPTQTPTQTPTPSPTPTGACSATMRVVNSWSGGWQGEVAVRAGTSPINGWTVNWTWPGGQSLTQLWGGVRSGTGSTVTVRNDSWNGSVAANGGTTFGFLASGSPAAPALTCTNA
ncbi:MAG TPA: cellulose binding domain-containing protein [Streptosporangiaceae bacterium]|nr:cellulose binding domain-containing protein [Streptosporangiaceae bacterium]